MTLKTPKEQAATDLAALFSLDLPWVHTVTYTPNGGSGSLIPAIVEYDENLDRGTNSQAAIGKLTVKASDIANPAYKDTVLIGSDTWKVKRILSGDSYVWKLEIARDERVVW